MCPSLMCLCQISYELTKSYMNCIKSLLAKHLVEGKELTEDKINGLQSAVISTTEHWGLDFRLRNALAIAKREAWKGN